jgi:uncharacterized cupredoxin-like copper-binding protein
MFGQPGDPAKVTRTIDVVMNDNMRFDPSSINVRRARPCASWCATPAR